MTDYMSPAGAKKLAAQLREFWAEQHNVKIWTEMQGTEKFGTLHVVRSNLLNGKPSHPVERALAA